MKQKLVLGVWLFVSLMACTEKTTESQTQNAEETAVVSDSTSHDHATHAAYACPMKCEGDKTYDAAGTCPVCKMDLAEVK